MNMTRFKVVRDRWGDYRLFPMTAKVGFDAWGLFESNKDELASFCARGFQMQTGIRLKKQSICVAEFRFKMVKEVKS